MSLQLTQHKSEVKRLQETLKFRKASLLDNGRLEMTYRALRAWIASPEQSDVERCSHESHAIDSTCAGYSHSLSR